MTMIGVWFGQDGLSDEWRVDYYWYSSILTEGNCVYAVRGAL